MRPGCDLHIAPGRPSRHSRALHSARGRGGLPRGAAAHGRQTPPQIFRRRDAGVGVPSTVAGERPGSGVRNQQEARSCTRGSAFGKRAFGFPANAPPGSCRVAPPVPRVCVGWGHCPESSTAGNGSTRSSAGSSPELRPGVGGPPLSGSRAAVPVPGDCPWLKRGLAHLTGSCPPLERGNYGIFSPGFPSGTSRGHASPVRPYRPTGFRPFGDRFLRVFRMGFGPLRLLPLSPACGRRGIPAPGLPSAGRGLTHLTGSVRPEKGEIMAFFSRDFSRRLRAGHPVPGSSRPCGSGPVPHPASPTSRA